MASINFTGNLGGEPVMDYKQSGTACLSFSVADTKGKKDAHGNWDKDAEQTQWMRCTLWGPDAEYYVERLRKGARVSIFGEFMAREYTDNNGAARTSLDVTVRGLNVINKRGETQHQRPAITEPVPSHHGTWAQGGWGGAPDNGPAF